MQTDVMSRALRWGLAASVLVGLLGLTGCATPELLVRVDAPRSKSGSATTERSDDVLASNGGDDLVEVDRRRTGSRIAPREDDPFTARSSATPPDAQAFADVITELQTLGALDPAAQEELMENLKRTDPSLWPVLLRQYRAALAYRRHATDPASAALLAAAPGATATSLSAAPTSGAAGARATSPSTPTGLDPYAALAAGAGAAATSPLGGTAAAPAGVAPSNPTTPAATPSSAFATTPPAGGLSADALAGQPPLARLPATDPSTPALLGAAGALPLVAAGTAAATPLGPGTNIAPLASPVTTAGGPLAGDPSLVAQAAYAHVAGHPAGSAVAGAAGVPAVAGYPAVAGDPATAAHLATAAHFAAAAGDPNAGAAAAAASDWSAYLEQAIRGLEAQLTQVGGEASDADEARLRMLYLLAGRREDALRPIADPSPAAQEFWSQQIFGLSTLLDHQRQSDPALRASEATAYFHQAATRLGELGALDVRNLAFCTEVSSYGVYKKFDAYDFSAGQEVLLYAEVDNFHSQPTSEGFHTALRSRYQIFDAQGHRIDHHEFAVTEEVCRNRRRDFFIRYHLFLPKQLYEGRYTLQLTIEDTLSKKAGQSSIEFTAKSQ